ncbi:MAG TPA: hypothetical protein VNG33_08750 [Polyangiaceae bacterium]|nr:hypothetical protein [Polyangiaceae bacterium]
MTYEPRPASSLALPALPTPALKLEAIRAGDAYTVWGVSYYLRNPQHRKEVAGRNIAVTGFVTKTNLLDAPPCALHRRGQADPENCRAAIPTFWLGDRPDAAEADCIRVIGWASNYAQIYDAIKQFDRPRGDATFTDDNWAVELPNPLPVAGAKVTVRGNYGENFTKASSGAVVDLSMGLLTYIELEYLQASPELATLPGVKRRRP